MKFEAKDCCPLQPQPKISAQTEWLHRLAKQVRPSAMTVSLGGKSREEEPVVFCDQYGQWWAGRYIGSVSFEGGTLTIEPRLGLPTIQKWLCEAMNVVLTESYGRLLNHDTFVMQLLALVWGTRFASAGRHGLPSLRTESESIGVTIRGRLDVAASVPMIGAGRRERASIRSAKSTNHAGTRAVASAYMTLKRTLGSHLQRLLPDRTQELLPGLLAATGNRPKLPTTSELEKVRYAPINAAFGPLAELSHQIASRQGLTSVADADRKSQGVLLDVAELWELYVLAVIRRAGLPYDTEHGTRARRPAPVRLLVSEADNEQSLGTLLPDAVLSDADGPCGVMDAKYKSLMPTGPQREDLYQMAAYLWRFGGEGRTSWAALLYPFDGPSQHLAESASPWLFDGRTRLFFCTLPPEPEGAAERLRSALSKLLPYQSNLFAPGSEST
jgi:5-methylcytosine-specific restriction enzyme subunit McrC